MAEAERTKLVVARPRTSRLLLALLVTLAGAAGIFEALFAISRHVASGNSDGATVVLEGQAMNAGHLLLAGWSLSLDAFWTVDVPFYALAVRIDGVRAPLMNLVPSVIALLVVAFAGYLATDGRRSFTALVGALTTVVLLALPTRAMALFFLQGPLHVATLLWCLIAFAALAHGRYGWGYALAICMLAAGILGDLQTLLLGALPILCAGAVEAYIGRDMRAGGPALSAPVLAGMLALVIREGAKAFGTFAVPRANTFASFHQLLRNIAHLPTFYIALLGVGQGPFSSTGVPLGLEVVRLLALVVVLGGPVVALFELLQTVRKPGADAQQQSASAQIDRFLLFCTVGSIATFIVLPITNSDGYARYLVPAVVCGATLGGRIITRQLPRLHRASLARFLAIDAVLLICLGAGFAFELSGPAAGQPAATLGRFLVAHHLRRGVGDYWSSSVVTVTSKEMVEVRPVIASSGRLVRYDKQSSSSWYGREMTFNFLVFNAAALWNGVDAKAAITTFGRPERIYGVGTYRVMVWKSPFTVSVSGSTGP